TEGPMNGFGSRGQQALYRTGQPPEYQGKHLCFNNVIDVDGDGALAITAFAFMDKQKAMTQAGRSPPTSGHAGPRPTSLPPNGRWPGAASATSTPTRSSPSPRPSSCQSRISSCPRRQRPI